jgi:sulfur relay (sulfurtransferase) DsrF/TusC family protein
MSKSVTVLVRQDPRVTHRPVEALRIALGLSAGDHDVRVVLLDGAQVLLTDDLEEVVDVEILEKYLPSLKQIAIRFFVRQDLARTLRFDKAFSITPLSVSAISELLKESESVLAF